MKGLYDAIRGAVVEAIITDELVTEGGNISPKFKPFDPKRRPSLREMFPGLGEYKEKQS